MLEFCSDNMHAAKWRSSVVGFSMKYAHAEIEIKESCLQTNYAKYLPIIFFAV